MWNVESATKEDADEISALYNRVWKRYKGILPDPLISARMPDKDTLSKSMNSKRYFIVRNKERIIGVVRSSIEHGACFVARMVVDGDFRKQDIGSALIKRVIEYAKENNASKVWLDTNTKLKEAMSFYTKMGFKECGHFKKHFWGDDVKFYELLLD